MKRYRCRLCKFFTSDRKEIRKHARKVHKEKGKPKREIRKNGASDISASYTSEES
jgi:hypothetical protein